MTAAIDRLVQKRQSSIGFFSARNLRHGAAGSLWDYLLQDGNQPVAEKRAELLLAGINIAKLKGRLAFPNGDPLDL